MVQQVVFAVISNAFVALIPYRFLRRPLADLCFKITFRLISSSLSAVITFHNKQYKPKSTGFCVANHTTPFDVAILSTDCTFSLVRKKIFTFQQHFNCISMHFFFYFVSHDYDLLMPILENVKKKCHTRAPL